MLTSPWTVKSRFAQTLLDHLSSLLVCPLGSHIHPHVLQLTVSDVIFWAKDNLLTERPELFVKDNTV